MTEVTRSGYHAPPSSDVMPQTELRHTMRPCLSFVLVPRVSPRPHAPAPQTQPPGRRGSRKDTAPDRCPAATSTGPPPTSPPPALSPVCPAATCTPPPTFPSLVPPRPVRITRGAPSAALLSPRASACCTCTVALRWPRPPASERKMREMTSLLPPSHTRARATRVRAHTHTRASKNETREIARTLAYTIAY